MRGFLRSSLSGIACAVALGTVALGTVASAAPAVRSSAGPARSPDLVLVDARCGHGWHYVPAGYARHGKWRDAHCSRN
jgi:hypothetical protein